MIIKRRELTNINDSKFYKIDIDNIHFDSNLFIKDINNVKGIIEFYYDESSSLFMHYDLNCNLICPGSITPDDVSFDTHYIDDELICFDEKDEGFYIKDNLTDIELVSLIILPLIPIKTENGSENMLKEGDGWTIISEKEYAKMNKEKVDPRLEILKNYKEVK